MGRDDPQGRLAARHELDGRQGYVEGRAAAFFRIEADDAAVLFGDGTANRQAQAGAAFQARIRTVGLGKLGKDARLETLPEYPGRYR